MNLFNVCTNVVVVGKINRSSSSSSSSIYILWYGFDILPPLHLILTSNMPHVCKYKIQETLFNVG